MKWILFGFVVVLLSIWNWRGQRKLKRARDLERYSRRVGLEYQPRTSRRAAEALAWSIAYWSRSTDKPLQPDTSLEQILSWMGTPELVAFSEDYEKGAECAATLEEARLRDFPKDRKPVFPDVMLGKPMHTTFVQLVEYQEAKDLASRRSIDKR